MIGEGGLVDHFDRLAVVVDWLDCCRNRNLEALLDLYSEEASVECACEGARAGGRSGIASYWTPKLARVSPDAFGLKEISPRGHQVVLDYLGVDGKPVRMTFTFDTAGKISHTRCKPEPR